VVAATVWTGPNLTITKTGFDPMDPVNQDRMVNDVWLTRGSSEGMFNIAPGQESGYVRYTSPSNTAWATSVMAANTGKTITATNYSNLSFTTWAFAYGGPGSALGSNIISHAAVVHLLSDDIYLNLQFSVFDSGGTFVYQRSTARKPGDADLNGRVNADDYFLIDRGYSERLQGWENGDFNNDGTINGDDYAIIDAAYGSAASLPASSDFGARAIPEPSSLCLAGLAMLVPGLRRHPAGNRESDRRRGEV
jgi:hypothetical protein